jgi:hypothetical protein
MDIAHRPSWQVAGMEKLFGLRRIISKRRKLIYPMWSALHPTEYYSTFVGQNVRPDGRGLQKVRKTVITCGKLLN